MWVLAASTFPSEYPNLPLSAYVAMGVLGALGFFASIVIHEFCHSLVARRYGLPMKGITLWILGGVAEMSDEPPSAKAEFLMAGAGPLASAAIALICYELARLGHQLAWSDLATGTLGYLARINLILLIFNLIPAFPLDGGRLLRALLWGWRGRVHWATRVASRIGGGFGIFLMVFGALALVSGNAVGGIWYFMIGLFIRFAAQSSYAHLMIRDSLRDIPVRRFTVTSPVVVPQKETIAELVDRYFIEHQRLYYPVVDASGAVRGCIDMAIVRQVPRSTWSSRLVADVMQPLSDANTIQADTNAMEALDRMSRSHHKSLLVMDQGHLYGTVDQADIMRYVSVRLELGVDLEDESSPRRPTSGWRETPAT